MPQEQQLAVFRASACTQELIAAQSRASPDLLAIQEGDRRVTFGELESRSDLLARRILANALAKDRPIGILLPASIDLIAAELAVWKAGAAFLPMDLNYPLERLAYVLQDASVEVIVTSRLFASRLPNMRARLIYVDDVDSERELPIPLPSVDPGSLAYVIFTSGSTGKPKGVMVEHRNLLNLIDHMRSSLELSARDRSSVIASPAFDASIAEIWPYLAIGASVHIAPHGLKLDIALLLRWLEKERITVSLLPTALVEIALDRQLESLTDLRVLITGGEQLHKIPTARPAFRFLNAYGPTECTVIASWAEIDPEPGARRPPSIGHAISGAFIRVLDDQLGVLAEGVPGEIYIGGAGVARGYLNHPELTAARFISDPLDPTGSGRLYRSGDLGCWRRSGELAFLGRSDRQIQLRGIRIEPEEIEFVLKQHAAVEDAAVVVQNVAQNGGNTPRLAAFLATHSPDRDGLIAAVRERVRQLLPAHMHPATYVALDSFPMTTNGKIDYGQLPLPPGELEFAPSSHASDAVSNPASNDPGTLEQTVQSIWCSTLRTRALSPATNFFDAGGDSLAMMRMLGQLEKQLGVRLRTAAFLHNPTLRHCLDLVQLNGASEPPSCIVMLNAGPDPHRTRVTPFFCVGGAGGGVHGFAPLARASALDRPFYGLESQALPEDLRANFSIQETARFFLSALLEFQPSGPYLLGGYSLGGLVAIEIAEALVQMGQAVHPLVLIDTYASAADPSTLERLSSLVPRLLTSPVSDSRAFVKAALKRRFHVIQSSAGQLPEFSDMESEKGVEVEAALRYMRSFTRCGVPVRLIFSQHGSRLAPKGPDRGWSQIAVSDFARCSVPGDHFSVLHEPQVRHLGSQLKRLVDG